MDRVDGARDGLADGGVARPYIFVADGAAGVLDKDVTAEQLAEAATTLEKALKIAQRVLGPEHPSTCNYRRELASAKLRT